MEKEFNRNQRSYRPRRNDSRDDYQGKNEERPARFSDSGRSGSAGRTERPTHRSYDRREREDSRDRKTYSPRPPRDGNYRREESFRPGRNRTEERQDGERKPLIKRGARTEEYRREYKRPDFARKDNYRRSDENERPGRENEGEKRVVRKVIPRFQKPISRDAKEELRQKHYSKKKILAHRLKNEDVNGELRLNRYISMGGICSRRDADELIVTGRVKVNGEIVQTVGKKVNRNDNVEVDGVQVFPEKKVYIVLNKPKDFVTTMDDPLERKTVMSLIAGACKERVYPVGRLDRQTTGVLLFTNDGDLAKKLTHPKYDHKKIYHVFLDKPLQEKDFNTVAQGVELEDGFIKADEINYTSTDCTEVGIEIHSGKNRIVRRIFEHLGYQIVKLDRVYFAGITKKNVPRGKWRMLTSKEVNMLKVY